MPVSSTPPTPPAPFSERMADLPGPAKSSDGKELTMFADGDDSPSFWDALDVINPLQHIPVVNEIYREMTGDKIGVGARMAGGTLFGGVIGLVAAVADCAVEGATGENIGGHALAMFRDDKAPAEGDTAIAAASPDNSQPAAPAAVQAPAAADAPTAVASAAAPATATAPKAIPGPIATPGLAALTGAAPKSAVSQTAAAQTSAGQAAAMAAQAATQKPIPLTGHPATATGTAPQAVSPLTASKPGPIPGPIATPGLLTLAQAAATGQTGQTVADDKAQDLALKAQAVLSGQEEGKEEGGKPVKLAQVDPGSLQTFDGPMQNPVAQQDLKFRPVPQRTGPATPKPVLPPHEASLLGVSSRQSQPSMARQAVPPAPAETPAAPPAQAAPNPANQADWFSTNVMQGLDKYQQTKPKP